MRLLEGEKLYPIYHIGAAWNDDGMQNNGTSFEVMHREDPGISKVRQDAMEWWETYSTGDKLRDKNPELIRLTVRFVEWETWCLKWFNHMTFNAHLSDSDLYRSFHNFVDRKTRQNEKNGHWGNQYQFDKRYVKGPYYCLMGAEDSWRWKGPCRCEHCLKDGKTFFDH